MRLRPQPYEFLTGIVTNPTNEPAIGFYMTAGSWFADWNLTDNFMRATLGTPHYGFACMWAHSYDWNLQTLGIGETLGSGVLRSANLSAPKIPRWLTIMGDPTLRLAVVAPPTNLTGTTNGQSQVVLNWTGSADTEAKYFVYRSPSLTNQFDRLTSQPLTVTNYTDTSPSNGQRIYQVRALTVTKSSSGLYTNLSQGVFKTIN